MYWVVGWYVQKDPTGPWVWAKSAMQLSTVTYLTELLASASSLPSFSPARGYTYIPSDSNIAAPAASTQGAKQTAGDTPMPDTQTQTQSKPTSAKAQPYSSNEYQAFHTMAESFALSLRYGNEYMDENPLVGEPGNFILSKSHAPSQTHQRPQTRTPAPGKPSAPPTPQPRAAAPPAATRKASKGTEKSPTTTGAKDKGLKRKKSKAAGMPGVGATTTPT